MERTLSVDAIHTQQHQQRYSICKLDFVVVWIRQEVTLRFGKDSSEQQQGYKNSVEPLDRLLLSVRI